MQSSRSLAITHPTTHRTTHSREDQHPQPQHRRPHRKQCTHNLQRWMAKWSNKKRKHYTLHIIDDDGTHTTTTQASARALHDYWKPKFTEQPTRHELVETHLSPYIQQIPPNYDKWTVTQQQHDDYLDSLEDSAPGPDGVRYSGWKNAPPATRDALYSHYDHTLNNDHYKLDDDHNHALLLFPPKGEHQDDNDNHYNRLPKDTRPISLSNTDNKHTSGLLAIPANDIANTCVSNDQKCVKKRQLGDNIIDIEAKALHFALLHTTLAGIISFDLSAAFPSLSRRYLFYVLRTMGFPHHYIRAIQRLYDNNLHTIFINGTLCLSFFFTTGVKQGCPLSMTLFALAMDPIIRYMAATISPHNGIIRGYCDDLAITTGNLILTTRHVYAIFSIIAAACNLHLNPTKTQVLCLTPEGQRRLKRHINKHIPQLTNIQFTNALLYLGMYIGPGASMVQYSAALKKFHKSVSRIRSLGLGLLPSIPLYNQQAFPTLAWKCAFVQPCPNTLHQERKSLQLLTNGPWNAIPNNLLYTLKQIGLPAQAHSLQAVSLAARTRNALNTLTTYHDNIRLFHDTLHHNDERVLHPKLHEWIDDSILLHLHRAVQQTTPLYNQLPCATNIQRQLSVLITPTIHHCDLQRLLHKRWTRFFTSDTINDAISNALDNLQIVSQYCKPCTTVAILKTWFYGWCTTSRFGNKDQPCPICSLPKSDTLRHFYNCPPLTQAANTILNQPNLPHDRNYFFLSNNYGRLQHLSPTLPLLNAIHIYCIFTTYNAIRHHPSNDITDTYHASLKQLLQHDPRLITTYLATNSTNYYDQHNHPIQQPQPPRNTTT